MSKKIGDASLIGELNLTTSGPKVVNMDHDEFFNSMNKQADELWNAINSSAGSIVNKFGAQAIVEYAKTRQDWDEWLAAEEVNGTEPTRELALLFVQCMLFATFSGTDLA